MTEEGELDRSEAGKHQEVYKNLGKGIQEEMSSDGE